MPEIIKFIETFLGAPLQLVIILFIFGVFLYWFIKERPKTNKAQNEITEMIMKECSNREKVNHQERENFCKIMEDYRVQNERILALYDKALENSTRAIENNTKVIENQNTYSQLVNQALKQLTDDIARAEEKLDKIDDNQDELYSEVKEEIIIIKNNK